MQPDSLNRDLGNGLVPGIRHDYSTTVKLHTYQFALCNSSGVDTAYFPDSSSVGLGFTVFGSNIALAIVKNVQPITSSFNIWPTIATNSFNVAFDGSQRQTEFVLIDELGRMVFEVPLRPDIQNFEVSTSELASGIYVGRLITDSGIQEAKVIVRH